jgi:catechol 2,3-dioxygenase-like lactoylglutathione lyase family enzyme
MATTGRTPRRAGPALLALLLAAAAALAEAPRVETVGYTVSDLDRAVAFFTGALEFERVAELEIAGEPFEKLHGVFGSRARVARLRLGSEEIELTEYLAPRGRRIPEGGKSYDQTFQHVAIVVSDMDAAYARLREHRVEHVSTGPQTLPDWNPNAGGIRAFYFHDPDGHALEVIWYPAGKGDPRWQRRDRLFLGIDHTAIVVDDTERSLAFWRDRLGFAVAGASENYGPEQERLNQVFGARLRITGLKGSGGPGIEFLEYLSPCCGRPAPADLAANDLAHWQTTLAMDALDGAAAALAAGGAPQVSPGVVAADGTDLGFRRGLMVRDPDGHAVRLVER